MFRISTAFSMNESELTWISNEAGTIYTDTSGRFQIHWFGARGGDPGAPLWKLLDNNEERGRDLTLSEAQQMAEELTSEKEAEEMVEGEEPDIVNQILGGFLGATFGAAAGGVPAGLAQESLEITVGSMLLGAVLGGISGVFVGGRI